jgi:sodium-dependent dicarboxylate transporter 2/3/5
MTRPLRSSDPTDPSPEPAQSRRRLSVIERFHFRDEVSAIEGLDRFLAWPFLSVAIGPLLALAAWWSVRAVDPAALPDDAKAMLAIFAIAAWYWVSGAIPPFATAVLVVGLGALLVGYPAGLVPEEDHQPGSAIRGWTEFVSVGTAPVVILMLGGFVLSKAAQKHGLDRLLAGSLLRPFATGPRALVLGVMGVTALFSMWMSNTATAALMLTLLAPIIAGLDTTSALRRAMLLAVPIGANLGGIGTPIGTPPNAVAFAAMREQGIDVTFLGWTLVCTPFAAVMLVASWGVLCLLFPPSQADADAARRVARPQATPKPDDAAPSPVTFRTLVVAATFLVTVALWLTSEWTRLPNGAIALIPIVVFTALRLIDRRDINALEWDILLLIIGGLALGQGMERSGLANWLVGLLPVQGLGTVALIASLAGATLLLSTFMSNTAAANLLIPLGFGVAAAAGTGQEGPVALAIALAASLAMALPVSTPPNAMAYARGGVKTLDFVRSGSIIGMLGLTLAVALAALKPF